MDIDDLSSGEHRSISEGETYTFEDDNGHSKTLRYGAIASRCEAFLKSYKRPNESVYHYLDVMIHNMMRDNRSTLVIDFQDLINARDSRYNQKLVFGEMLYNILKENPLLFIKAMRKAAFKLLSTSHFDYANELRENFRVVVSNATDFKREITEIVNSDVGKLVYTENFVVSISSQKNVTKRMAWYCGSCGRITYKDCVGFRLPKIKKCEYCDSEDIIESDKDSVSETMQEIKLQQKYERITSGRVPKTIMAILYGKDMINRVRAGDICSVTGIIGLQRNPTPYENAISDYFIEIQWIEKKQDDFLIEDDPELEQRVKKFIDPNNEDLGYEQLVKSIAPSVLGHEIIKEALLLQLVGSDVGYFPDNSRHRGEGQILLVGEAATAKSKLATYVYQLYARAVYVSAKVTEAGMTASVSIANKTGHAVLEAGAYLLASSENGGIVVADEMEKTMKEAREALAGCTDDRQMVEIHKGPIHQSIQINCASLHIANPKTGESWDSEKSIKENTGFENWYLTRFCTWIVRDEIDKELDTKKASHYLKQFGNTIRQYNIKDGNLNEIRRAQLLSQKEDNINGIKSVPEMRMYYKYARKNYHPAINPKSEAAKKLVRYYVSVRPQSANNKAIKVSMRSLGDLVRFAEMSARAHFRNQVTEKDADIAIKIVMSSIASSGFNQFTGEYEQGQKSKKEKGDIPLNLDGGPIDGYLSSKDLLANKNAAIIVGQDMEVLARKRRDRFYRDIAKKMKKFVRLVKHYAMTKCPDCNGDGYIYDGNMRNQCYPCLGQGGYTHSFYLGDVSKQLFAYGVSVTDINEIMNIFIKKKILTSVFDTPDTFQPVNDFRKTIMDMTAIEANIALMYDTGIEEDIKFQEHQQQQVRPRNPELLRKIQEAKDRMSQAFRDNIRKELAEGTGNEN